MGVLASTGLQGESFIISEKVDPALLGGVIVQLGDKYVDLSTIKRIREIERILQEPVA
jgi:F-type H+-transporting ATPase subunit O